MEPTEEQVTALVTESMGALSRDKAREILMGRADQAAKVKAEAETPSPTPADQLGKLNKEALLEKAASLGLTVDASATKAQIIEAITAAK